MWFDKALLSEAAEGLTTNAIILSCVSSILPNKRNFIIPRSLEKHEQIINNADSVVSWLRGHT